MRGERQLLRIGEYVIARACRHLPAEARDERYREWVAELPAILQDPDVRPAARRTARMLRYASGTIRGTAVTPGSRRRMLAHSISEAAPFIAVGLVAYFQGWAKTPQEWIGLGIGLGIGWLVGSLAITGGKLAYRRIRGKGLGDDLTNALEARAAARAQASETRAQLPATDFTLGRMADGVDEDGYGSGDHGFLGGYAEGGAV